MATSGIQGRPSLRHGATWNRFLATFFLLCEFFVFNFPRPLFFTLLCNFTPVFPDLVFPFIFYPLSSLFLIFFTKFGFVFILFLPFILLSEPCVHFYAAPACADARVHGRACVCMHTRVHTRLHVRVCAHTPGVSSRRKSTVFAIYI